VLFADVEEVVKVCVTLSSEGLGAANVIVGAAIANNMANNATMHTTFFPLTILLGIFDVKSMEAGTEVVSLRFK
jgi:hypothetical protein